jgi:hypothetical protein
MTATLITVGKFNKNSDFQELTVEDLKKEEENLEWFFWVFRS